MEKTNRHHYRLSLTIALLLLWCWPVASRAEVRLPAIFSDHLVLTRGDAVPVWGKADPGEAVAVAVADASAKTQAGADGRWKVQLDLSHCGQGPFELSVVAKNRITVGDVLIGATWLASGQSNMEFHLKASANADEEIAHSSNPLLRQFVVKKTAPREAKDDCQGQWTVASPETSGDFSAVAYYFGKKLQKTLNEPVGIINASWGGTFIEAWISPDAIAQSPGLHETDQRQRQIVAEFTGKKRTFVDSFSQWLAAHEREDRPCTSPADFAAPQAPADGWTPLQLPGPITGQGLPSNGALWVRRQLEIPEGAIGHGQPFKIMVGHVSGFEQVYWNGKKVWETPYQKYPGVGFSTYFAVPDELLHAGASTIAIRIYAPASSPQISVNPDAFNAGIINMRGTWLAKAEYELPPLSSAELAAAPLPPDLPPDLLAGSIFNGMIHPLLPYRLEGVIWYQGESNTGRAVEYRRSFPLLIEDWRRRFGRDDLPFYFCQIANFGPKVDRPTTSGWAELRESQSLTLSLPNTGQAVLIDLGESADAHFRNKRDAGERLARIALAKLYHQDIVYSGPVYRQMTVEGATVRLIFDHTEGGLKARPSPATYDVVSRIGAVAPLVRNSPATELEGFAICGADRRWVWADVARIDGDTVVVSSAQVEKPVAVRFGWADDPTVNLENGAGLPASPFRTDDFPLSTENKHY